MANRSSRVLLLVAALTISASLATALVAVSQGIEARLGESMRAFGANLIVEPAARQVGAGALALGDVSVRLDPQKYAAALSAVPGVESVCPRVSTTVALNGDELPVLGIDPAEMTGAKWRLRGALPAQGQALVGVDIAARYKLSPGSKVPGFEALSVSGIVESGSEDDQAVVLRLDDALRLTGGRVTGFLLRGDGSRLDGIARAIETANPELSARTVRQVADAERSLLDRVRRLLFIVTLSVALVSAIAVGNTQSIVVLERTEEIGLLKAMGATRGFIAGYFALEGAVVALAGGVLGLAVGVTVAETIAASVFGATIPIALVAWPIPFAVAGIVSAVAGALPVWRASAVDASSTLKGL